MKKKWLVRAFFGGPYPKWEETVEASSELVAEMLVADHIRNCCVVGLPQALRMGWLSLEVKPV